MKNRKRYTVENIKNNRFYQMPKFLFEGEFKNLSNDARVLYSMLKDRHELSLSNNWINEKNEVYLIFTREDMANMLGCSQPTLRKAIKKLIEHGLIEEERRGLNKPNVIFLNVVSDSNIINDDEKKPIDVENTGVKNSFTPECKDLSVKTEKNLQSKQKDFYTLECKNLSPNDTDINNTNFNDTKSISQSKEIKKDGQMDIPTHILENCNKIIKKCELHAIDEKYRDAVAYAIRLLYLDIENKRRINIGDNIIPVKMLKEDLEKLNFFVIDHAVNKFKVACREKEIKNKIQYLKTCIYNAIHEIDVDVDGDLRYRGLI